MELCDFVSLAASIFSLALAIIAIALSIVFFKMSSELNGKVGESANKIQSGVERVEALYNTLHSEMFSLLSETVSDLRKHSWPGQNPDAKMVTQEVEQRTDEKMSVLRGEFKTELDRVFAAQNLNDGKIRSLARQVESVMERAIEQSSKVEVSARAEAIRQAILERLFIEASHGHEVTIGRLLGRMQGVPYCNTPGVIEELENMRRGGLIGYEGKHLSGDTAIAITPEGISAVTSKSRKGSRVTESPPRPDRADAA